MRNICRRQNAEKPTTQPVDLLPPPFEALTPCGAGNLGQREKGWRRRLGEGQRGYEYECGNRVSGDFVGYGSPG
jgi:hypothetical protein